MMEVKIVKKPDDDGSLTLGVSCPTRISLGGGLPVLDGYYCVYRGKKEDAIVCLEQVLVAMRAMASKLPEGVEPDTEPDWST